MSYLPLDKNVFLRVQCMINQLENSLPEVRTPLLQAYQAFTRSDAVRRCASRASSSGNRSAGPASSKSLSESCVLTPHPPHDAPQPHLISAQLYNALLPILLPSARNEKLGILSALINKDRASFLLGLTEQDPASVPPRVYISSLPAELKLHLILYQVRPP